MFYDIGPGAKAFKPLFFVIKIKKIKKTKNKLECFLLGRPLQPSLRNSGKARIPEIITYKLRQPLALLANIRLGWKDLPESNAVAYLTSSMVKWKRKVL
jgi:hypothetical protein